MLTMFLCLIPHSSFILSLSKPFLEVPLYWYDYVGTCRREIMFEMNHRFFWSYCLWARCTLSASSQPAPSPSLYLPRDSFLLSHLCPSIPILRLFFTKPSRICSYTSHSKYSPCVTSVIRHLFLPLWCQAADPSSGVGLKAVSFLKSMYRGGNFYW